MMSLVYKKAIYSDISRNCYIGQKNTMRMKKLLSTVGLGIMATSPLIASRTCEPGDSELKHFSAQRAPRQPQLDQARDPALEFGRLELLEGRLLASTDTTRDDLFTEYFREDKVKLLSYGDYGDCEEYEDRCYWERQAAEMARIKYESDSQGTEKIKF